MLEIIHVLLKIKLLILKKKKQNLPCELKHKRHRELQLKQS